MMLGCMINGLIKMTEQEYFIQKKQLLKLLDKELVRALHHEITPEQYFEVRKQWKDLINNAKKQQWFKHI